VGIRRGLCSGGPACAEACGPARSTAVAKTTADAVVMHRWPRMDPIRLCAWPPVTSAGVWIRSPHRRRGLRCRRGNVLGQGYGWPPPENRHKACSAAPVPSTTAVNKTHPRPPPRAVASRNRWPAGGQAGPRRWPRFLLHYKHFR